LTVLDAYLAARAARCNVPVSSLDPAAPLFASIPIAGRSGDRPIDGENFSLSLRSVARNAGIPHADELVPHSLRHTSGTALHQLGLAGRDVQEHLRHASLTTTGNYLHASSDRNPAQVLATELATRIAAISPRFDEAARQTTARARLNALGPALSSSNVDSRRPTEGLIGAMGAILDLCDRPMGSAAELATACRDAIANALSTERPSR
ncbi:MAG: tyrosine-type recombinase/integrase, partial [Pseudonocardiaceae bacterium]